MAATKIAIGQRQPVERSHQLVRATMEALVFQNENGGWVSTTDLVHPPTKIAVYKADHKLVLSHFSDFSLFFACFCVVCGALQCCKTV